MSTVEKLNQAIVQYIENPNTDYAIMINGQWGSGKTYYLKTQLFPHLKEKKTDFKLIYVSLFGVTDSADLNRRIFLEVYPLLNTKAAKLTGAIGKAVLSKLGFEIGKDEEDKLIEEVYKSNAKALIVFDDLERLDGDILIEILGAINQLVEHGNVKVIISANESELLEQSSIDLDDYKRYIEKVVRHKMTFKLDFEETASNIGKSAGIDGNYRASIQRAFVKSGNENLRTLQYTFSLAVNILQSLKKVKLEQDLQEHIADLALYFLSSLSIEFKSSGFDYYEMKKLASWSFDKPKDFSQIDFSKIEVVHQEDDSKKLKNKDSNLQEIFFDKYFEANSMMYFDSIVEYLESGYWDEKKFIKEITDLEAYYRTKGGTDSNKHLNILLNWVQLDDKEVVNVVDKVLNFARKGEFQIDKYVRIFATVDYLIDEKIINYQLKKVFDDIQEGIKQCQDQEPTPYLEDFISIDRNDKEELKALYKATIERNRSLKSVKNSDTAKKHFELLVSDPQKYSSQYLNTKTDFVPPLNSAFTPAEFLSKFNQLPNHLKFDLRGVFYHRQQKRVQMTKSELRWMRDLQKELDQDIQKTKPSVEYVNKRALGVVIGKVIDKWSSHEAELDD